NAADAIVVLGAGRVLGAPELGGKNTVQKGAFERLRYAARLYKVNGKPVLLSGGAPGGNGESEAELMKDVLEQDFNTPGKWTETKSVNTIENARFSRDILFPLGVKRIYLVTHAAHMLRAKYSFEKVGFTVIPAPVGFLSAELDYTDPRIYFPNPQAIAVAFDVWHEWVGLLWYKVRF
ncbi:MAG: YdcF family protein, partial [Bdellovibrionota bacterium]